MNLINCYEKCLYQKDGSCKLSKPTAISAVKVNGCSYFRPIKLNQTNKSKTKSKNLH